MGRIKPSIKQNLRRVKCLRNITLIHILTFHACLTNNVLKTRPMSLCNLQFVYRDVETVLSFTARYYENMNVLSRFLQYTYLLTYSMEQSPS